MYVGITDDLCRRFADHRTRQDWWAEASRVEWEEFPTRLAAMTEEGRLIRRHRPPHNTAMNGGWRVVLTANESAPHREGCRERLADAHRAVSLGDRL